MGILKAMSLSILLTPVAATSNAAGIDFSDMLAFVALLISVGGVISASLIHKDSGGRVKVEMLAAAYSPFSGTGSFLTNNSGRMHLNETRDALIEMCQVVIENPGRVGVTVTSISLNVERKLGERYTVTPRSFILAGFTGNDASGETYFRLEPYDRRTVLFDYWSIVDSVFRDDANLMDTRISAEVTVAGHDHPFDSKKKGFWRIQRNHISAIGDGTIRRPRNAFLLEMLRGNTKRLDLMDNLDHIAVVVEESLTFPASTEDWKLAIGSALDSTEGELVKLHWEAEIDRRYIPIGSAAFNLARQGEQYGSRFKPFPPRAASQHAADA